MRRVMKKTNRDHFETICQTLEKKYFKVPVENYDFYSAYENDSIRKKYTEYAKEFIKVHLKRFKRFMFEKLFYGISEMSMLDNVMQYYRNYNESEDTLKSINAHLVKIQEAKKGDAEEVKRCERMIIYVLYNIAMVRVENKKFPKALETSLNLKTKLKRAEPCFNDKEEYFHLEAKFNLLLARIIFFFNAEEFAKDRLITGENIPKVEGHRPPSKGASELILESILTWSEFKKTADNEFKKLKSEHKLKDAPKPFLDDELTKDDFKSLEESKLHEDEFLKAIEIKTL
jgi:hypothetical protein